MKKESEQIEGQQETGQIVLAVTKVVFEMITFGFEDVVVFVLDFPAGASGLNDGDNRLFSEVVIGDKSIIVELFPSFAMGDGDLTPIDQQGRFAATERNLLDKTAGDDFGKPSIPPAQGHLVDIIASRQGVQPFVQDLMTLR